MNRVRGMTLIELLIVLAIVGVLASMAMPGMRAFLVKRAALAGASTLSTDFRFARSEALKSSNYVTICRSTDGATCASGVGSWSDGWIVFTDFNKNQTLDGNDRLLRVQQTVDAVESIQNHCTLASTLQNFTFKPQGLATPPAADTWKVTGSTSVRNGTLLVVISNQGRLAVREAGATAPTCP